jgi:choline-sulfatase
MSAHRPNILLILSDQHNPKIAGFAGDPMAETPNLDALAEHSTRFDAAYCQTPLCVPSRLSFLTGRYPFRLHAWNNGCGLRDGDVTFADLLGRDGYTTAAIGKMHLRRPNFMGGFQHRPYGDLMVGRFCFHQPDPPQTWDGRWCDHSVGRFPWAGETQVPESLLADGVVTREAVSFLLDHQSRSPEKPWLLMAGYSRPHFPLTAPARHFQRALERITSLPPKLPGFPDALHPHDRFIVDDFRLQAFSDDEHLRALAAYYACVSYLDECIGLLIAQLDKSGLLGNTCVIYASDHGDMAAEKGLWCKRTYYDASARVPLLIRLPGQTGSSVVDRPVQLADFFPTFCDLAGVEPPEGMDGASLLPVLTGSPEGYRPTVARSELLTPRPETAFRMARDARWKYVEFPEAPPRLFDMVNDPEENFDLLSGGDVPIPAEDLARLRDSASGGLSWDDIARLQRQFPVPPPDDEAMKHGPVQYQLNDGRIVDADGFLYPGIYGES